MKSKKWIVGVPLAAVALVFLLDGAARVAAQVQVGSELLHLTRLWDGVTSVGVTAGNALKADITSVAGTAISLGQKAMSASIPVVLPSDQSAIPTQDNFPFQPYGTFAVHGDDTLRVKAENSWPQNEQVISTVAACDTAGSENFQEKLAIKFRRKTAPQTLVTSTNIITMDNDRGLNIFGSAGLFARPFGAAASKGRTVTDANSTFISKTISAISVANPTQITTPTPHGLTTGDMVRITGTNSTPVVDGLWHVQNGSGSTFNIAANVTGSGNAGTVATSKTLTSPTAAFTGADVGKNISISNAQVNCPSDGTYGTDGPFGTTFQSAPPYPCQGPKFPNGLPYQGIISGFTNGTTVTVKPSMPVNPGGSGTLKIEPVLVADSDGLELGDGWIVGVDVNYWGMGLGQCSIQRGQAFMEVEINRDTWSTHQGITLIKQYIEVNGHLSWPYGNIASGKVDGHGYIRNINIANPSAGANWNTTVPIGAHWRLIGVTAQFTASATVANRTAFITATDYSAHVLWPSVSNTPVTAGQTRVFNAGPGVSNREVTLASGTIYTDLSMPPIELNPAWVIGSVTSGIQAGDTWTNINLIVEEWITN